MPAFKPQITPPRRRRLLRARGISLIEMAVVMAASVLLLGATTTALVALYRADRGWSQHVDELRSREQLLHQLRRDLHAAQEFAWNPADATLRLTMADGGEMTYRRRPQRWERRLKPPAGDDKPGAALASAFPAPSSIAWEVTPADGGVGDLIHIRLIQPTGPTVEANHEPPTAELVVTIGRDWRLLQ